MKKAFRKKLENMQIEMGQMTTSSRENSPDARMNQSERVRKAMLHRL
jgi:hypothetical protein